MLYLITYDLVRPTQDEARVSAMLQALGAVRVLQTAWIAESPIATALAFGQSLLDRLNGFGGEDRILVLPVSADFAHQHLLAPDPALHRLLFGSA